MKIFYEIFLILPQMGKIKNEHPYNMAPTMPVSSLQKKILSGKARDEEVKPTPSSPFPPSSQSAQQGVSNHGFWGKWQIPPP